MLSFIEIFTFLNNNSSSEDILFSGEAIVIYSASNLP